MGVYSLVAYCGQKYVKYISLDVTILYHKTRLNVLFEHLVPTMMRLLRSSDTYV
jgi:hypothetical protein